MIFFLEILRRNPLSKFWPKMIPLRTIARVIRVLIPNHTYIGSKDAGVAPATFKPIFKAIGLHVAKRGQ